MLTLAGKSRKPLVFLRERRHEIFQRTRRHGYLPAGQVEPFEPGQEVEFDPDACGACKLGAQCTKAASGRGRTVMMREDEALQKKLRQLQQTRAGRVKLRERVAVEHTLAHLANRQGPRARYRGLRKNVFDLRRMAVIQNLETVARHEQLGRAA